MKFKRIVLFCIIIALVIAPLSARAEGTTLVIVGEYLVNTYADTEFLGRYESVNGKAPYTALIYERLFDSAGDEYLPVLAESYEEIKAEDEPENTNVSYSIKLRQDAFWHDGTPFTSDDVLCGFYMSLLAENTVWDYITAISAPDANTVIIDVKQTSPAIARMVLAGDYMAFPAHIYGELSQKISEYALERDEDGYVGEELRSKLDALLAEFTLGEAIGTGIFKLEGAAEVEAELVRSELSPFYEKVGFERIKITELEMLAEDLIAEMEFDSEWFIEDFFESYIGEDVGGTILMDGRHNPLDEKLYEVMREILPDLRTVWLPGRNKISYRMNNYYPLSECMVRKAIQFLIDRNALLLPETMTGALEGTLAVDDILTGMPDIMRDAWLDEEAKAALTKYSYNPEMAEKIFAGTGFEKLEDGLYQDDMLDVPMFDIITSEETLFYAPYAERATMLETALIESGFDAYADYCSPEYYDYTINNYDWILRLEITPYIDDPLDIYKTIPDRVLLSDGTIVFLSTVIGELITSGEEERGDIIKTLAVIHNDIVIDIPLGDVPTAFYVSGGILPDVGTTETGIETETEAEVYNPNLYGVGFEPVVRLLRAGELTPQ